LSKRRKINKNLKFNIKELKLENKNVLLLEFSILFFFAGYFMSISFSEPNQFGENPIGMFSSEYTTENLRGDKQFLYKYWRLPDDQKLKVNIINPISIDQEKIELIKEVVTSTEKIQIEDSMLHKGPKGSYSTYYLGWMGAVDAIIEKTDFPLPRDFEIFNSRTSEGDIIIILSNIKDRSGNTGYTRTVLEGNEIVKSFITIYDVNSLSNTQLQTIARHEFGHALGLAHATAPEDLMAPVIDMTYPYISHCNISALKQLYNGDSDGTTTCEK